MRASIYKLTISVLCAFWLCGCSSTGQDFEAYKAHEDSLMDVYVEHKAELEKKIKATFTDAQLISLLDSIGKLNTDRLVSEYKLRYDTLFGEHKAINRVITNEAFDTLRHAVKSQHLTASASKVIFGVNKDCCGCPDHPQAFRLISFDDDPQDLNEFAIEMGCESNNYYFFKRNRIICSHRIDFLGPEKLSNFKHKDGHSVVYYINSFEQKRFFKYSDTQFVHVLELPQNEGGLGYIKSGFMHELLNQEPFTLKVMCSQQLMDTAYNLPTAVLVNDSMEVTAAWDSKRQKYVLLNKGAAISEAKILTYFTNVSDSREMYYDFPMKINYLLFLNVYYSEIKLAFNDPRKKRAVVQFLKDVKYKLLLEAVGEFGLEEYVSF